MTDKEAEQMAGGERPLTQEQLIAVAMLGKMVQSNVNDIKKASTDGGHKIPNVDMSKVMPSSILKAAGTRPPVRQVAPPPPPVVENMVVPELTLPVIDQFDMPPKVGVEIPMPVVRPSKANDPQTEFDFDRKARYEDIMRAVEKLEERVIMLTELVKALSTTEKKN
jgi:hypothetical protein